MRTPSTTVEHQDAQFMAAIEMFRQLLQQANAQGSRSTVLNPLGWAMCILAATLVGLYRVQASAACLGMTAVLFAMVCLLYMAGFVYFGIKSPDALRSERFSLSKLAIEKKMIGDSGVGFGGQVLLPPNGVSDKPNQTG